MKLINLNKYHSSLIFFLSVIFFFINLDLNYSLTPIICFFLIVTLGVSHGALDNLKGLKLLKKFNIKTNEDVFFFEDSDDNLKIAKNKFKWNTILISPVNIGRKPKYIDYVFKTIEEALLFFIVKDKFTKKKFN